MLPESALTDTGENVQKWTRVFFDSALSHTRRSDASEKKRRKILASTFGRFRLWTSFESSPVSVKILLTFQKHTDRVSERLK